MDENNLLTEFQSGFRNGHSCATALIRVSEDIRINMANNKLTVLALLDIKSAYPSVAHSLLFHTLMCNGFGSSAIDWIKCFISNKSQYVNIEGNSSNEVKITCGLIQGDNLSQTFFSLIINGITRVIIHCKIHLYADDVALYIECDPLNPNDAIDKINEDIKAIDTWIENNGMQLNPSKTQTIITGSKWNHNKMNINVQNIKKIIVKTTQIEYSQSVKYLGFNFNMFFNSENQVNAIVKNVNFAMTKIRHCRNSVNLNTKLQLIRGVICPIFDYASIIYHGSAFMEREVIK